MNVRNDMLLLDAPKGSHVFDVCTTVVINGYAGFVFNDRVIRRLHDDLDHELHARYCRVVEVDG